MLFSIIIPTYNREKFLPKAIESVINQSHNNWELIIVDDGSTDNTKSLIEDYQKKENRIKYIFQENKERSVARNNGIKNAKGDWICFLDSDDLYHETHLKVFYNFIKKNKFKDAIYFSGVSFGDYENSNQNYDTSGKNNLEFVLINSLGAPRACCSKSILLENKFNPEISIGEDKELWSRIAIKSPIYYHSNKTFIEIEHNNRSINNDNGIANLKTIKYIANNTIVSKKIKNSLISNAHFKISTYHISKNKKNQSNILLN